MAGLTYPRRHVGGELVRDGDRKRCPACRRWLQLRDFRFWGTARAPYCRPCWLGYTRFRRSFRRERGRWPTRAETLAGYFGDG